MLSHKRYTVLDSYLCICFGVVKEDPRVSGEPLYFVVTKVFLYLPRRALQSLYLFYRNEPSLTLSPKFFSKISTLIGTRVAKSVLHLTKKQLT